MVRFDVPMPAPLRARDLVAEIAHARIGSTFNQYAQGPRAALLRERLAAYLTARADASLLLVGEAPGYRGARVSGLPFTSERQLTGVGPAEATATIVQRTLAELGVEDEVLLWNVVPTHPGTATSNRAPTRAEVAIGRRFCGPLAVGRTVVPVGRVAQRAFGLPGIRHPARGGAAAFRRGLADVLEAACGASAPVGARGRAWGGAEASPDAAVLLSSAAGDRTIALLSEHR